MIAADLIVQEVDSIVAIDALKSCVAGDNVGCGVDGCSLSEEKGSKVTEGDYVDEKTEGLGVAVAAEEGSIEL